MKFDSYDYSIAAHFLPALINNDLSGLEREDVADFQIWSENTPAVIKHWDASEETHFGHCEVTGLSSDCVIVRGLFPVAA